MHLPEGVRAGNGDGRLQRIARALCHYRWLPYEAVPAAERKAFVRLQLKTWAPFESSAYAVASGLEGAMAFAWDQSAFEQRALAAGLPTRPAVALPETMLLPSYDHGVVLQACSSGVEGQVWRSGQLVASRWWPETPDVAAWLNFQRSVGVPPGAQLQQVPKLDASASHQALDGPWAPVVTLQAMEEHARLRQHALAALLLAGLVLPTLWLLHANWTLSQQNDALQAEETQLTAEVQPALTARSQALVAMTELDKLVALVGHPDALSLLGHLGALLTIDGSRIRSLELDGPRLRLVLAVPTGTPRITYVRALEGGGWLQNVREDGQDATPGSVALSAEIRGSRPVSGGAAIASTAPGAADQRATVASAASVAPSASDAASGVRR